jgi:hypothetical protein
MQQFFEPCRLGQQHWFGDHGWFDRLGQRRLNRLNRLDWLDWLSRVRR